MAISSGLMGPLIVIVSGATTTFSMNLFAMRTDVDHLTVAKRQELARVVQILSDEFDKALAGRTAPYATSARILKVILFGSYARGDWVADPVGGYFSDFDVLVVVNHDELTEIGDCWRGARTICCASSKLAARCAPWSTSSSTPSPT